jgi:hypothetical protein
MVTSKTTPAVTREQVAAMFRAAERNERLMAQNPPGWLDPYRGQWVIIHEGKVIAHSPDGSGLAEAAPPDAYPGSLLERVPTREESKGVLVV